MSAYLPQLPALLIEEAVRAALLEDLGRAGDITSNATIPPVAKAVATLSTREDGVLAGIEFARAAFRLIDPALEFDARFSDGAALRKGDIIAVVSGPARSLLSGRARGVEFHDALVGHRVLHRAVCGQNRPHQSEGHMHPQDASRTSRIRKIRRAHRRRLDAPLWAR